MNYRYVDNVAIADIAFEAWGRDIENLFMAAADATMHVMVQDLDSIRQTARVVVELNEPELDLLLFRFLNEFLFHKDAEQLLLRVGPITVSHAEGGWRLRAQLAGEPIDRMRHRLLVDVKAVTLHRFAVEQTSAGWKAFVVLDI